MHRGDTIVDRAVALGRALQTRGVAVSLSEIIDATQSVFEIDVLSRSELREALRATLVKDARHDDLFEREFDIYFPVRPGRPHDDDAAGPIDLVDAIATGSGLADVAAALIDQHAGLDGTLRSERHHVQRVLHAADLARLMSRVRTADPSSSPAEIRARVDALKRLVAADVRLRLADEGVPVEFPPDIRDVEFLEASRADLDEMRRAIQPIARKLAARLARKRRHRSGRVNFRRTVRRSLATGGVPLDVTHDRPRAHKPELFVLCDISGSVADFSLFTLTLMSALSAELARTRSFVFVDAVDEVTDLLDATGHAIEPWQLLRNTAAVANDGHSDYGAVFEQFWSEVAGRHVTHTTTVIITGDGRTNHRPTGVEWLTKIHDRSRKVFWLNPEPRSEWNTHDSEMDAYGAVCDATFEVRTLRQLVACVERVA